MEMRTIVTLSVIGGLMLVMTGVLSLGLAFLVAALIIIFSVAQAIPRSAMTPVAKLYVGLAVVFLGIPAVFGLFYSKYPMLGKAFIARNITTERNAVDLVKPDYASTYLKVSTRCDRLLEEQGNELEKINTERPTDFAGIRSQNKRISRQLAVAQKVKDSCDKLKKEAKLAKEKPKVVEDDLSVAIGKMQKPASTRTWQMPKIQMPSLPNMPNFSATDILSIIIAVGVLSILGLGILRLFRYTWNITYSGELVALLLGLAVFFWIARDFLSRAAVTHW